MASRRSQRNRVMKLLSRMPNTRLISNIKEGSSSISLKSEDLLFLNPYYKSTGSYLKLVDILLPKTKIDKKDKGSVTDILELLLRAQNGLNPEQVNFDKT